MMTCCPCDELQHPPKPDIAAGLSTLPRQLATFLEYRLAMLREIPPHTTQQTLKPSQEHKPLATWRAREGDDFGLMLLEMWAYVLDILGFYDERIANESYLRTAVLRPSTRRLVELIGYHPRPALAAAVVLAAIAEGQQPVTVPARTGFRSDPFDDEPPQIFETEAQTVVHALTNEWTLGSVRKKTVSDRLLLDAETARLTRDQIVVFVWPVPLPRRPPVTEPAFRLAAAAAPTGVPVVLPANGEAEPLRLVGQPLTGSKAVAGKVVTASPIDARDQSTYIEIGVDPAPQLDPGVRLADVQVLSPSLRASVRTLSQATPSVVAVRASSNSGNAIETLAASNPEVARRPSILTEGLFTSARQRNELPLDTVYSQIHQGDLVIISLAQVYQPFRVVEVEEKEVPINAAAQAKALITHITVAPPLPEKWANSLRSLTVHFNFIDGGKLTRVAKTALQAPDFAPPDGVPIADLAEPIPEPKPGELLLQDANDHGVLVGGGVDIDDDGAGHVTLNANTPVFDPALRTPVAVFGNLIRTTRGESVFDETLGSGNAAQAFQSFTLVNSPLTYINEPAAPNGRRSTLTVRVNRLLWKEVTSFYGAGPEDEVYIVRQTDDEETVITFGDGTTGARLPTGVDNLTATYRFGAGAAKPPAGTIAQLARPVEGLRRVVNPVAAGGGADADQPKDIRQNAPSSALLLGRAVSIQDFEALAREFGGVINAYAEWAWDETCQGAVVKVWFISDGGKIKTDLEAFLIGQADPNTPLIAQEAIASVSKLVIDLKVTPRFIPDPVVEQVRNALINPETGILALENILIGRPLFRSRIFDAILNVEGVEAVRTMTVNGDPAPFAITIQQGQYHHVLDTLGIHHSTAGKTLAATPAGAVVALDSRSSVG